MSWNYLILQSGNLEILISIYPIRNGDNKVKRRKRNRKFDNAAVSTPTYDV